MNENVHIASIATATPLYTINQAQAEAFLVKHYSDKLSPKSLAIMHKIFTHPSVQHRHLAIDNLECLVNEHPDSRIARYTQWAVDLSSQAIIKALTRVGLTVDDVSGLVVNTCTGYICPGISTYLIENLGFSDRIRPMTLSAAVVAGQSQIYRCARICYMEQATA